MLLLINDIFHHPRCTKAYQKRNIYIYMYMNSKFQSENRRMSLSTTYWNRYHEASAKGRRVSCEASCWRTAARRRGGRLVWGKPLLCQRLQFVHWWITGGEEGKEAKCLGEFVENDEVGKQNLELSCYLEIFCRGIIYTLSNYSRLTQTTDWIHRCKPAYVLQDLQIRANDSNDDLAGSMFNFTNWWAHVKHVWFWRTHSHHCLFDEKIHASDSVTSFMMNI